jgi:hypothetical protein
LAKVLRLNWSGRGEFHPNLFDHPRQRDGEREEGAVKVREKSLQFPVIGLLARRLPRERR